MFSPFIPLYRYTSMPLYRYTVIPLYRYSGNKKVVDKIELHML